MRNESQYEGTSDPGPIDIGSVPLIRTKSSTTGIRFIVQGFNTQEEINYPVIGYYVGLWMIFLSILPYIWDFIILVAHPDSETIYDRKYRVYKAKNN